MKRCQEHSPKAKDPNYICNPKTGRWVKKLGDTGRKVMMGVKSASKPAIGKPPAKPPAAHPATKPPTKPPTKPSPTKPVNPNPKLLKGMLKNQKFLNACNGKSASGGGMNVTQLVKIAESIGYEGSTTRKDIIDFLCYSTGLGVSHSSSPQHTTTKPSTDMRGLRLEKIL